jgi:hypothetical protein
MMGVAAPYKMECDDEKSSYIYHVFFTLLCIMGESQKKLLSAFIDKSK